MVDSPAVATHSDEVKIRLKHKDWEVEITCVENKVKDVVQNVLYSIDQQIPLDEQHAATFSEMQKQIENLKMLITSNTTISSNGRIRREKKSLRKAGMTCRVLLESLWEQGYFVTQKLLAEIHEELLRRGYSYDRTAVSHSLTDMVREGILVREGTARNYHYLQKSS